MRRFLRRLYRLAVAGLCLLSLLSLLACVGVAGLWQRSHHGTGDRVWFGRADGRYIVRSEGGRVTLYGPPPAVPAPPASPRRTADAGPPGDVAALGGRLDDGQVQWLMRPRERAGGPGWAAPEPV